ncbi:MAG: hypothetical protein ABW136_03500 [Steroidobacteraceae bacterium]
MAVSTGRFAVALALSGAVVLVAVAAQPTPPPDTPGATGDVAGHVPAQAEQARRAPVREARSPRTFDWWSPGEGRRLAEYGTYRDDVGELGVLLTGGALETRGHAFFEPIGTNGRACVTCHQPENGMSISVPSIQERWRVTGGKDPLFAAVDGMNCPDKTPGDPASHSLLLQRGLFRVFLPWPPRAADGSAIEPEFSLEVVRDPTGCNTSPKYGLKSANPMVSVYRRPRVVANTKYVTHQNFGVGAFVGKNGLPSARDPETGRPVGMNLMSDARQPTLKTQAVEAAINHLQSAKPPTAKQLEQITGFEGRIYVAQAARDGAGSLVEADGPPAFGPRNLARADAGVLGNNTTRFVFPMADAWKSPQADDVAEMRASIRRGHDVYFFRTFWIRDSMHLNTVGLGNPTKRTCATCHGMHMTAMDVANGWMDIGTTNQPWAREAPENPWTSETPQMPLFRVECRKDLPAHPYLGRVIYTQDPGRALISGKCNDVGTIVMQQFRGLAARPPYFSNGSAGSLRELIDFYDRRYNIQYSEQEKLDLEHFLGSL